MSASLQPPLFLDQRINRREVLRRASNGFGALALTALLSGNMPGTRAGIVTDPRRGPLESKAPHFPPRARSVIFLFMEGAVSQVDSFDYKPMLAKYHGEDPRKAIGKLE